MESEEATVTRWVAIAVCVVVASIAGCEANSDYQARVVAQAAFQNTTDPIAVGCALGKISATNGDLCQLHATHK